MKLRNPTIVMRDVAELSQNTDGIYLVDGSQLDNIRVKIMGPDNSPYHTAAFFIRLLLPEDYPYSAPEVRFDTSVLHPNVSSSGRVCMDRLAEAWKPSIPIKHVCSMVRCLLTEPNVDSPLNIDAAAILREDPEMYDRTVMMWAKVYANGQHSYPPFEEKLSVVEGLTGDQAQALKLLTRCRWDLQRACDRVI